MNDDPARWDRVKRLFQSALERAPEDRERFLREACPGDQALLRQVESLLMAHQEAGTFAERPAIEGFAAAKAETVVAPGLLRPPEVLSTDPLDQARFIPGTMVANRYRVVALLGRGGMGEVYRAEDLKLGQPVALKFLPDRLARAPERLARFHQEVRLSRQIAHPNVCRVYDIGESDGQHFLSMEYVDGEDLASLLRRIGRLPADKAVQLAQQLCAGLAAAHERGVLHGDLKPANVLVDGRGLIRIVDFGLAGLAEAPGDPRGVLAGTPGYMAPEQLTGRGTSMRSDVYALGLVLYEMFTGRAARDATSYPQGPATWTSSVTCPSQIVADLDPAVERVILRCLEEDPARRPPSAVAVAAALPGGDPLAAAIAAGEIPSPDLVAAAGGVGSVRPAIGVACLVTIALGIAAIAWMSQRTTITGYVPLSANPAAIAERARAIAVDLGYTDAPADTTYFYELDYPLLQRLATTDASPERWERLRSDRLTAIRFFYRQSPQRLEPVYLLTRTDPPDAVPGMVTIVTDSAGRVTRLTGVRPPGTAADPPPRELEWAALFRHAGLDMARFTPVASNRVPPVPTEERATWEGKLPDGYETPVRIEAGAYAGTPVYFEIIAPWTDERFGPSFRFRVAAVTIIGSLLIWSAIVARRNVRLRRADRRRAFRSAVVMSLSQFISNGLFLGDVWELTPIVGRGLVFAWACSTGVVFWMLYAATEPYVRRLWPEMLVGWSRLLSGRFRDPLVGRDVLVGTLAGIVATAAMHLNVLVGQQAGLPPPLLVPWAPPVLPSLVTGGRFAAAVVPGTLYDAVARGLFLGASLVLLTVVLRGRRRGAVALSLFLMVQTFASGVGTGSLLDLAFAAIPATISVVVLVRFGLLAMVVHFVPRLLLISVALQFSSGAPYVASSYMLVGVMVAMAFYGFQTALGGRSIFGDTILREEPRAAR